ncbi:uncharacterized protein LOC112543191 [Python bivittatus]|uniref:Uncharacterized protein LOC112543191 n=1 Tax=Python bivittatus TaxID=176946 RepID=A0A9F5N0J4_PYTBI|nr:uncharacterized protein LOC112543191 [Python bivittatus]
MLFSCWLVLANRLLALDYCGVAPPLRLLLCPRLKGGGAQVEVCGQDGSALCAPVASGAGGGRPSGELLRWPRESKPGSAGQAAASLQLCLSARPVLLVNRSIQAQVSSAGLRMPHLGRAGLSLGGFPVCGPPYSRRVSLGPVFTGVQDPLAPLLVPGSPGPLCRVNLTYLLVVFCVFRTSQNKSLKPPDVVLLFHIVAFWTPSWLSQLSSYNCLS